MLIIVVHKENKGWGIDATNDNLLVYPNITWFKLPKISEGLPRLCSAASRGFYLLY